MNNEKMSKSPIFIVGCDRSGTTLLRLMLNSHPNIAIPSETDFIADIIDTKRKLGDLSVDANLEILCKKIFNTKRYRVLNLNDEIVRKRIFSSDRTYSAVLAVPFELFAEINNKVRWGDKTPRNILYMLKINELFPQVKFIHIIRDGRDVASSLKRMKWFSKNIVYIAFYWQKRVLQGQKAGVALGSDKYLEVFYEKLVTNPEDVLKKICAFISEDYTPQMLEFQKNARKNEPEFENYSHKLLEHEVTSQQIGRWQNDLTEGELIIFETINGRLLDSLGYRHHFKTDSFSGKIYAWYLLSTFTLKSIVKSFLQIGKFDKKVHVNEQSLVEVRNFLEENIRKTAYVYFGVKDDNWVKRVTNNYFNDQENYDERWKVIKERIAKVGRVLDMSCGCGTFVLYGLNNGYDVWGIDPEEWVREYFRKKIFASNYPIRYLYHFIAAVGEALPFENESFDLITTYQTLEHVSDVEKCLNEMLRVLKPGGILYIRAPDYNSFYEGHYRVPFLPKMNRKLASIYLKLIGRPLRGIEILNLITEKEVIHYLIGTKYKINIEHMKKYRSYIREEKIRKLLPSFFKKNFIIRFLNRSYELQSKIIGITKVGREENHIDLWVTKSI